MERERRKEVLPSGAGLNQPRHDAALGGAECARYKTQGRDIVLTIQSECTGSRQICRTGP
jgi:hypothetical protein